MTRKLWPALVTGLLTSVTAWAGTQLDSTRSACTAINCAGQTIRGTVQGNEPFVAQVYAAATDCLRLDVSQQSQDLIMHMIGPFRFAPGTMVDDRGGGDLRPVIVYDQLGMAGWYTVIISLRDQANLNARFTLEYGRYTPGNPNCFT